MNGGTIRRVIGWRTCKDDWYWHDSEDCASEWYDNESAYLVCGVAGSSPCLNQHSKDKVNFDDRQLFVKHSLQRGLCERLRDR